MTQGEMLRIIMDRTDDLTERIVGLEVQLKAFMDKVADQQASDDERIKSIAKIKSECDVRFTSLENRGAKLAAAVWKKIGTIALTVAVTSIVTFIITKISFGG